MGLYGIRESAAVQAYDETYPGVEIPPEQKLERVEREAVKSRYGYRDARRKVGSRPSIVVTRLWPGHPDYEE